MLIEWWLRTTTLPLLLVSLGTCPPQARNGTIGEGAVSESDSVLYTGDRLFRLGKIVSAFGSEHGVLPATLAPVIATSEFTKSQATDLWGRRVGYLQHGRTFELRSAGSDGAFGTGDDIVAKGQVGRDALCELHLPGRVISYADLSPPCTDVPGK